MLLQHVACDTVIAVDLPRQPFLFWKVVRKCCRQRLGPRLRTRKELIVVLHPLNQLLLLQARQIHAATFKVRNETVIHWTSLKQKVLLTNLGQLFSPGRGSCIDTLHRLSNFLRKFNRSLLLRPLRFLYWYFFWRFLLNHTTSDQSVKGHGPILQN